MGEVVNGKYIFWKNAMSQTDINTDHDISANNRLPAKHLGSRCKTTRHASTPTPSNNHTAS
jgi:hypothetical protein